MLNLARVLAGSLLLAASAVRAEEAPTPEQKDCPMHARHMAEKSAHLVDARHDSVAPSHEITVHHFRLYADGGAIELRTRSSADKQTVEQVRAHLRKIHADFVKQDFSTPAFVHGKPPDGVERMGRLHSEISYTLEELPDGAKIGIVARSAAARAAVHDFMRFQIDEHRTGDSGKVERR